ncbi:MAG: signal peptidase II [Fibrobacter sp.]|nr:signal peptidase II [Fibrobacter sp.]
MVKTFGKYAFLIFIFIGGLFSDLQTKKWALKNLEGNPPRVFINGIVDVGFAENHGMIFGILNDKKDNLFKVMLKYLRIIILLAVLVYVVLNRKKSTLYLLPLMLILAGAGNVVDIFARGYVVDFIHLHFFRILDWPFFFNLADAYLCIGMVLLILYNLFTGKKTIQPENKQLNQSGTTGD